MLFGQGHRRIEADDREVARHVQDGLNDRLTHLCLQIIELSGVIPREGCSVIAVIDIAHVARLVVAALKDNRRVGPVIIMILQIDPYARIIRKIFRVEGIRRIR